MKLLRIVFVIVIAISAADFAQAQPPTGWVPRGMEYSLDYYFVPPLPPCAQRPRPVWLHQLAGQLPVLGAPKPAP